MSLSAAVVRELIAAGLAGDELAAACERIEKQSPAGKPTDDAAERRRAWDRKRQAEKREEERERKSGGHPVDNPVDRFPLRETQTPSQAQNLSGSSLVALPVETKAKREKSRRRLPDDWTPNEAGKQLAFECGMSAAVLANETLKFADHHRSKGNLMACWDAAWRTWARNWMKWNPKNGLSKPSVHDAAAALDDWARSSGEARVRDAAGPPALRLLSQG